MNFKNSIFLISCITVSLPAMEPADKKAVINDFHEMKARLNAFVGSRTKNPALLKPAQDRAKIEMAKAVLGSNPTVTTSANLDQFAFWGDYLPNPNKTALILSLLSGVAVVDPNKLTILQTYTNTQPSELSASPNNTEIALSDYPASVWRFNIETGQPIAQLFDNYGDCMQYNNDGTQLIIGSAGGIFDMTTNTKVISFPPSTGGSGMYCARWNPANNNQVAVTVNEAVGQTINIFDITAQKYIATVAAPVMVGSLRYTNSASAIVVSAAQQFIACNGTTAAIQAYYDINGNKSPNTQPFPVPTNPTFAEYFLSIVPQPGANGRDIVIAPLADQNCTIIGFDLAQSTPLFNMQNVGPQAVGLIIPSPDGSQMAEIQSDNPQVQLWNISNITKQPAKKCALL